MMQRTAAPLNAVHNRWRKWIDERWSASMFRDPGYCLGRSMSGISFRTVSMIFLLQRISINRMKCEFNSLIHYEVFAL